MAFKSLSEGGILSYESERNRFVSRAKTIDKPLSEMEKREGYIGINHRYKYFLLAAELLAKNSGESNLLEYHALQNSKTTWRKAFEKSFGMTIDEFYELFEEHRAAGFPDPNRPTPTGPQTVNDYIIWKVGDEVSSSLEAEVRETVLAVHNYAVGIGMPRIGSPITIFLHRNLDALAAEFEATTGREFENRVGPDFAAGRNPFANGSNWVMVNTSADRYQEWSAETRERQLGGHLTDALQREMSGLLLWAQRDQVPHGGPEWLLEGSRQFLTYQALRPSGPESCDPTKSSYARISESVDTPLSEAETSEDFWALKNAYRYGFLAVELLAEQAGPESIMGYFASLRTGVTWHEAFESAFGMTVEEFYQLFDERSAARFTRPRCPLPPPLVTLPGAPDYVKWEIGSDVRPEYIEDSVEGVRLMHEYAESLGMSEIEVKFTAHLYYNQDELKIAYLLATGSEAEWVDRGSNAVAYGPGFFTDTLRWEERNTSSDHRKKISAHELFHVFQEEWSSGHGGYGSPGWFTEGTAEYFAFRALDAGGVWSYAEQRRWRLVAAGKRAVEPLRKLERGLDRVSYGFLLLAVELLASRAGERAVLDYYMLPQPGTTWQEAFETAFGMTVDEFYELFEEHRAAGFPDPNRPTPTGPQTVDDYIVWKVGDEVSPSLEAETRETVLAVHNYAVGIGMPRIGSPITIFLYHNLDSLAAAFEANTGEPTTESWYWPEFSQGKLTIFAGRDWIAVNTSATRYQEWSPDTRKRELAGNLFDLYRRALTGIWQGTPRDAVDPEGPQWLRAGSREYLTWQALRAAGPESCDPTRGRYARFWETADTPLADTPLSDAETQSGYESMRSARQHSFLAVELLAEQAGPESIMGYFASLRTGVTWQEAFESAFGMIVEEFYQLFDERSAAGFTLPRCPTLPPLVTMPGAPEYVKWEIEDEVPDEYVQNAVVGVKIMHDYIVSLGMPSSYEDITIYLYHTLDGMISAYARAFGVSLADSRGVWGPPVEAVGVGGQGGFFIWAGHPLHSRRPMINFVRHVAGELIHSLQADLNYPLFATAPRWLTSGSAYVLDCQALAKAGLKNDRCQREKFISDVGQMDTPLMYMETWTGFSQTDHSPYPYSALAAELLANHAGHAALMRFFHPQEPGTTWREAFQIAFGMTVDKFYILFEEHRAAGFPEVDVSK